MKKPFRVSFKPPTLASDAQLRGDYVNLKKLDVDKAQSEKERLEDLQRHDAKLRQKFKDARKKKEMKKMHEQHE